MKDMYFSPDKSYVVAFYHKPQNDQARELINMITGRYRQNIFEQSGGDYWKGLFCWPTDVVEHGDKVGIVVPSYQQHFFSGMDPKITIFSGSKDGKKKENGLPAPTIKINSSILVNGAILSTTSKFAYC